MKVLDLSNVMSDSKKKQVIILAKAITPEPGGIETYSEEIAKAYCRAGFKVTVISCFRGKRSVYRRGRIRLVNVGMQRQWIVAIRMFKVALKLRKRRFPIGLIHATSWRVAIPAIAVFPRSHLVITVHGREVTEMSRLMTPIMRIVFSRAHKALVISGVTLAAAVKRVPSLAGKSVVSWNGITGQTEDSYSSAVRTRSRNPVCRILTICRLVPRKNVAAVLGALAILVKEGCVKWEYSVVGQGQEYERLVDLSKTSELRERVCFHGRVSDQEIRDLYGCSNIFVHPQVSGRNSQDIEGFGLVIADAMAWGLPVLVGKEGGPKEYVNHGVTGYIVDGTNVQEVAAVLKLLIESSEKRNSIGSEARAWVDENLSWTKHIAPVVEDVKVLKSS